MRGAMAIADEVLNSAGGGGRAVPTRIWLRLAAGFVLGLVLVAGAAAAGLYAWDQSYEARVLPGVTAAGVNLAGMDRAQATAALDQAYQSVTSGTVVLRTPDGDLSVPYAQFGRRVDTAAMADAALRAGRDGTMAERALGQLRLALTGTNIEPNLLFDERALAAAVAAALHPFERARIDAQVVASPTGPSFLASRTVAATTAPPPPPRRSRSSIALMPPPRRACRLPPWTSCRPATMPTPRPRSTPRFSPPIAWTRS